MKGKKILIAATGGIAAYKVPELSRLFIKSECEVQVALTENAARFVQPLTLETLTRHPVLMDDFALLSNGGIPHIEATAWCDILIVAPATGNIIGKTASGIADDIVSTLILAASRKPVLFAPAMNSRMYLNPVMKRNVSLLREMGYHFIGPDEGEMACGEEGIGRLADLDCIVEKVKDIFTEKDLKDTTLLISAGPTQEPIDPVRFITNRSSGKMGYAIAHAAKRRGGRVILVSGPTRLSVPKEGVTLIRVKTALEMESEILEHFPYSDIVIMAAAVADYRTDKPFRHKLKKSDRSFQLELVRNPDILQELGTKKTHQILVGFAAETEKFEQNATQKIKDKNLDLIVVNDVSLPDAGFEVDTNRIMLIDRFNKIRKFPLQSKEDAADSILDKIIKIRRKVAQ
ncbi:MAG: bifunctional phosphopantothenoylcysteine decarboxylase/phosphopantothenate--cysteine ligase CoaBC [Deltaproteobacteria bacterium]|nr:MAG: bifunctional phosphopantothenoylcysteine decarboxylase/phosphopantothenate--cysteine ligase CoaBC [Deltaproteobacteria bacterium]